MTLVTSGVIQRQLWRPFHKTGSKIVLKGGLGAGIGAFLPKGGTLKATMVVFSNEVCSTFTVMSSWTLLSDHVYTHFSSTAYSSWTAVTLQMEAVSSSESCSFSVHPSQPVHLHSTQWISLSFLLADHAYYLHLSVYAIFLHFYSAWTV